MRAMNYIMSLMLMLFCVAYVSSVQAEKAVGRVVWVKGTFTAEGPNGNRSLERAGIFYEKDTLVTNASSQAQVVFSDNSLMTFREGTRFRVDQYNFKPAGGGSNNYAMSLAQGGFRTITGAIGNQQPQNYHIKTPVATIGVRGTEFIAYYNNGRLYVGRIKGKPCVYDPIKRIQVCLTAEMPFVIIVAGQGSEVSSTMPAELGGSDSLVIVPAIIQPPPGGGGGGFGGGGGGGVIGAPPGGGEVSSFCVQ